MHITSFFGFDEPEELNKTYFNTFIDKLQNSDNDFVKLYLNIIDFINVKCYK